MIAMDDEGSERMRDGERKRERQRTCQLRREAAPADRRRIAQRMEILRHEVETEDFINVRGRKDPDWKTKGTHSEVNRRLCRVLYPSLFV